MDRSLESRKDRAVFIVNTRPLRVGIEGPCCAGKTTLGQQLRMRFSDRTVHYVPDYSDYVGGGLFLPPALPRTLEEEARALWHFLGIEIERTREAWTANDPDGLILIDRSAHTLLAHCHALSHHTGTNYRAAAETIVGASPLPMWPDLIIYLDINEATLKRRYHGKFDKDSIFVNPIFNAGIRAYFEGIAGVSRPRVAWLDADVDARLLSELAAAEFPQATACQPMREGHHESGTASPLAACDLR